MHKNNIGLIVHGPIKFKGFDCNLTIENILKNYSSLFRNIVICTWESEKNNLKDFSKYSVKFNFLNDPGNP